MRPEDVHRRLVGALPELGEAFAVQEVVAVLSAWVYERSVTRDQEVVEALGEALERIDREGDADARALVLGPLLDALT